METREFFVQGSTPDPYQVVFKKDGSNLTAHCTCPAGQNGIYCKHRFGILEGSRDGIVSDNEDDVAVVVSWLKGTDVETAMDKVKEIEREQAELKRRLGAAKKLVARAMFD